MDASVLLLPELGLIDAHDPRFASTVAAIESELVQGRHVMRYAAAGRFRPAGNRIPGLPLLADRRAVPAGPAGGSARALRGRARACATITDSSPRIFDPKTGRLWGNFPQTYSMAGLILSAMRLSQELGGALLARIFIISNRVAMPQAGASSRRPGSGAEGDAQEPSLRLAGLERARSRSIPRPAPSTRGKNTFIVTDLTPRGFRRILQRLRQPGAVADPALPARPGGILPPRSLAAICASTSISPTSWSRC